MGVKEMKYRVDCKVEMMEAEIATLSDTIREEIYRMEEKFVIYDKLIEKLNIEQKEQLFNLKAE